MTTIQQIDSICDEFEENWTAEKPADFQLFCDQIDETHKFDLLKNLVQIDVELRLKSGHDVKAEDYSHLGVDAVDIVKHEIALQETVNPLSQASEHDTVDSTADSSSTKQIGPYRLLQQIGEGGMGTVWMAEQRKPVRRRVALKVIKGGMADRQVIARFEAERQALTMMDHQCIARVLDAGETADGNPFFVMELVNGIPITKYCDKNKLSVRHRLQLMIDVCQAIQHAHQKGIIHRDLKPGNVLVGQTDGKLVPKVIDFGLAKALDHGTELTDKTMFTEFGQVVGTVQYMAPEQAELNSNDIDTRTDVYALGVILYELLTGSTPLDRETIGKNALLQILEMIREREPQKPSDRLNTTEVDANTVIGDQRQIAPARLKGILRGELDWVVMKALEKDRTRRYDTAAAFADDIQRFLNNEPVQARPPSVSYRIKKFATKYRGLVAASAATLLLLLTAAAVSFWFSVQANHARNDAIAQKEVAETERKKADAEALDRSLMLDVLVESFDSVHPDGEADASMSAKDVLLNAIASLEQSAIGNSSKAKMMFTLSSSLNAMGASREALPVSRKCVNIFTKQLGRDHPDTLKAMNNLAMLLATNGDYEEALELRKETLDLQTAVLGDAHADTVMSLHNLAILYRDTGQIKKAIPLFEDAFEKIKDLHGEEHADTIRVINNLAYAYSDSGNRKKALSFFERAMSLSQSTLGKDHPDTLISMHNLGQAYEIMSRHKDAMLLREKTLKLMKNKLGEEHPHTVMAMAGLAVSFRLEKRIDESIALLTKAHEIMSRTQGEDNARTLAIASQLATIYQLDNRAFEALDLHKKILKLQSKSLGEHHPSTLMSMNNVASLLRDSRRIELAMPLFNESYHEFEKQFGADHPLTRQSNRNIRQAMVRGIEQIQERMIQGEWDTAETIAISLQNNFGPHDDLTHDLPLFLHTIYMMKGQYENAFEQLNMWQKEIEADAEDKKAWAETSVAMCSYELDRSRPSLNQAKTALSNSAIFEMDQLRARLVIALSLEREGKSDQAISTLANHFDDFESVVKNADRHHRVYAVRVCKLLAELYLRLEKPDEAKKWNTATQEIAVLVAELNSLTYSKPTAELIEEIVAVKIEKIGSDAGEDDPLSQIYVRDLQRICDLYPERKYLCTLANAEYRLGHFDKAMATATASINSASNAPEKSNLYPIELALLAMSARKLDDSSSASDYRKRFDIVIHKPPFNTDVACQKIANELKTLFE